jgi:hypothetical protein
MRNHDENQSPAGRLGRFFRAILDALRAPPAAPQEREPAQPMSRYLAEAPQRAEKSEASREQR